MIDESDTTTRSDYAVGYGRPPVQTRFQKGQSGNPRGRPLKSQLLSSGVTTLGVHDLVLEEAYRKVRTGDGDQAIDTTVIQATVRALAENAIKGDRQSQIAFKVMAEQAEAEKAAYRAQVRSWALECKRRYRDTLVAGEAPPEVFPHPDDIFINLKTGDVTIIGPWDKRQKCDWDLMAQERRGAIARLEVIDKEMKKRSRTPTPECASCHQDGIAFERHVIDFIDALFPAEDIRRAPDFDPQERAVLKVEAWREQARWEGAAERRVRGAKPAQ